MPKIIIPTDFSDTSVHAIRYGCYLADLTGYEPEIVHIHDGYDGDEAVVIKKGSARVRSRVRERLEKFVALHADALALTGIPDVPDAIPIIMCRELVGSAITQLEKLSEREDTAMIVMGGVGSGTPNQAMPLFGSVARAIALRASCPVFLIPQNYGVPQVRHSAIAFDKAPTLVELSAKSQFLREALSPKMHFTHVQYKDKVREEMMEQELLNELLDNDFPGYPVEFDQLPEGDITNVLIDYALERDIDLLILGRHPHNFLRKLLLRPDISDIVGACAIPMMVVPLGGVNNLPLHVVE